MVECVTRAMSAHSNPCVQVAEDELHAYVDGLLPPDDRGRVESYLSAFPHERERIEAYRRQNVHLHRLFDWYMRRPDQGDFDSLAGRYARRVQQSRRLGTGFRAAALAGIVLVSGSFGWMGHSWFGAAERARGQFIQQAVEAHFLSRSGSGSTDRFAAVGYGARDILAWMASSYEAMPRQAPDFRDAGFDLVGGRVIPTGYGPAVQFLYVDESGRRVTLFMGRSRSGSGNVQTLVGDEKLVMIHRQKAGLGYSLIGNEERATMFAMARIVSAAIADPARIEDPA